MLQSTPTIKTRTRGEGKKNTIQVKRLSFNNLVEHGRLISFDDQKVPYGNRIP